MAHTLDSMDLKQIITLHLEGLSNRKIGQMLSISRNTVNSYLQLFQQSDYTMEELLEKDTSLLEELFTTKTTISNERFNELMRYFDKVNEARKHPGFTFLYHYHVYKQQASHPYGYTQFMEHYNRKHPKEKGSMKLEHKPGYEVFFDYAGKKLQVTDKKTGQVKDVEVFIAMLPHSQYTYVEASWSQKREDMLPCMANALSYFEGVPKAIISDNLKSAVTRACKHEPIINRMFKDFARHYGCVINPTRGYAPQDKALVENAVNLVYQRIYYPLRNMVFFSLEDLNREIRRLLKPYNDLLFQRKEASRRELYQRIERSYLKSLPNTAYEIKYYRRAKVQKIGYVYFSPDKSYYSVPYRYIGKNTQIHYTKSVVEVYYNHERIAFHKRHRGKGVYHTHKEHLRSAHKAYSDWSPEYFKKKAAPHGQDVLVWVERLLEQSDYPETAYKRAMGVIQLHREYGSQRLNNACRKALLVESFSYRRIKNILKNNQDTIPLDMEKLNENKSHIPKHDNQKGANAFQ